MRKDYGSYYFTRYYFKREDEPRYYFTQKGERYYFNKRGEARYSLNEKGEPLNAQGKQHKQGMEGMEDVKFDTHAKFYGRQRYSPLNEEDMENLRLDQQDITSLEYMPKEAMFDNLPALPPLCAFYGALILIIVVSEFWDY